jgi:hypothetical protein
MKYIITLICTLALYSVSTAQSRTTTVEYIKVNRQAVVNDIPFPEKTIMNAIDNKMEQMGYKGKDSKGFTVYKGVKMPELGNDSYDLYFMADKKSRKDKENCTLTLMITKGFDSFVSDSSDVKVINNAKSYLDTIKNMIAAYDLEQQIMAQEDVIKKANKKFDNYVDDGQSLEKKRKNIEKEIEDNKKNQANQQAEIEKQKQILETLRGKRTQ